MLKSDTLLVLALARESELIFWLSVRDFVDAEPLVSSPQKTWQVTLHILNIIQSSGKSVVDVNDNDFPVCFFLVEQSHDAENLDLLNLTCVSHQLPNFADIERVIVTLCFRLGVNGVRVFPCLIERQ